VRELSDAIDERARDRDDPGEHEGADFARGNFG